MCTINYELYYSHALKIVVYLFQQMLILAILIPMLWRSKKKKKKKLIKVNKSYSNSHIIC